MSGFGPELPPRSELRPGIRRFVAPNPSMMTGPGTNTYLFGTRDIAVLDPGPVIEGHLDAIEAEAGGRIRWVLATHTHPDHSPGATVLARRCGAELLGRPAPEGPHQDREFAPQRVLEDGDVLETDEFALAVVHTPGHASNHLCFHHLASNWLFTGDHIVDGSTVVIDPPDGNMNNYLEALRRVRSLEFTALAPGHGDVVHDPERLIDWIIAHRLQREEKVVAALRSNPGLDTHALVPHVYRDVDKKLYGWAERSLLAHLEKLLQDEAAKRVEGRWFPSA